MTGDARPMAEILHEKLTAAFAPEQLKIVDESEQHRGHSGWREGGETHFRVVMQSARLSGMSRVARSRAVHDVLRAELVERVHALAMELSGTDAPAAQGAG